MRAAPGRNDEEGAVPCLAAIARSVGLLGAVTPRDAHLEHAALLADYARGHERLPAWSYEPTGPAATRLLPLINGVAQTLSTDATPLGALYRARADEVRTEIEAVRDVGTPAFAAHASARFAASAQQVEADALAASWCDEAEVPGDPPTLASDDRDPRSLVSRLRAEVARRRLPFAVRTSASLSALAAISGDTLWVAEGRRLASLDVERTVTHEIEAHALPRTRARASSVPIFAIGTAGGCDDQEGYALWLEERRGVSGPGRRRELGARHLAASQMRAGADFVTVVRGLLTRGVTLDASLRAAERAFRGSDGTTPGLGRERVYIEAFLRVTARLSSNAADEEVLSAGQVAVAAIDVLRPWAGAQFGVHT